MKRPRIVVATNHHTGPIEKGKLFRVISTKEHRSSPARKEKGGHSIGLLYLEELPEGWTLLR